mgnify:CR=1 FL=1
MATYDVDGAQARLSELVGRSLEGEKITIASAEGNVVMVSEEDWDSLVETLSVMLLPEVRERIAACAAGLSE